MRTTRGTAAAALVAALVVAGVQTPASADPAPSATATPPATTSYLQPDVPRTLDLGLLPATGDKRFARAKNKAAAPAQDKSGRTYVYVEGTSASAAKAAVREAGGVVLQTRGNRVRAAVAGTELIDLAGTTGVAAVRQPDRAFPLAVTSEGVEASGAGTWIRAGHTGAGVRIGIVDIGFDGLSDAQDAGELPAGVTLHGDDCPATNGSTHGTAVAEIVHDMAPDAELYLACAPDSMTFASAVSWLTSQNVQVVNASIGFPNTGRGDGTGVAGSPSAVVRDSRAAGALWVAAAGNQAQLHWAGPAADADADGYVEVNGSAQGNGFTIPAGGTATVSLRWDAWPTTRQDLDLLVLSANRRPTGPSDTAIVAQSTNPQATATTALPPTEQVTIENTSGGSQTYWIYLAAKTPAPAIKADVFVMGDATSMSYAVASGSLLEPASSPYAMAVGASQLGSGRVDDYSSQGPTADGRTKPDITGQSAVSTYTFGPAPTMAGTSAAAAHVTGAAALLMQAGGGLDAAQVQALLEARTQPSKFDNQWGHGLLALGAPDDTQPAAGSGFTPLQLPRRILNTSTTAGGHQRQFTAGEVYTLPISDLPGDATAVAVTLTANASVKSAISLYRDVDTPGEVSTLELGGASEGRSTTAIVPLSAARTIAVRNDAGTANVYLDLIGYFSPSSAGTYFPKDTPVRLLDTHTTLGGHQAPAGANETLTVPVRGVAGVPDNATGVLVNVHSSDNSLVGYLQVFPQTQPSDTGSLATQPVSPRSVLSLTGIGDDGAIRVRNSTGLAHVVVDLLGWFAPGAGAKYVPLPRATKVLDSRTGTGVPAGKLGQGDVVPLSVGDVAGVPRNVTAPVLALTGTAAGSGSLSLHAAERGSSGLTDVDGLTPGRSVSGGAIPRTGTGGQLELRADAGTTDLVAAVTGYFVGGPALPEQTGSCALDAEASFTPLYDGRSARSKLWKQAGAAGTITDQNCELSSTGNTSYLWSPVETQTSEYTLRLDYKTTSASSDSGVLLGFGAPPDGTASWPGGHEIAIKPNGATTKMSGSIESFQQPVVTDAEKGPGEWNALEVTVHGKRITVKLNGIVVNDYVEGTAARLISPSYLALQGSVAGDLVTFRNVRIRADEPVARFGSIVAGNGACIDVINGGHAISTQFQAIACRGNDAQLFTVPGDGTIRIFGLCLDANGPARTGTFLTVKTYTCNSTNMQQWEFRADGTIYNEARNACLDSPATGAVQLYTYTCHGAINQQWTLPADEARFGPILGDSYSNMCVDVVDQTAASGAQIQMAACKADIGSQQWTMPADGSLRIYGYCLDQNGPIRTGTYHYLYLYACNATTSQQWTLRPGEQIYHPGTNQCVDVYAPTATAGRMETYPCNKSVNQRWSVPALGQGTAFNRPTGAELVASWQMDENNGTVTADATPGKRNAALTGPTWTTGHTGAGLTFNGTSAYASNATTALQTDRSYSISAWAKVTGTTTSRTIVAQQASARTPFALLAHPPLTEWEFAVTSADTASTYTRIGSGAGTLVNDRWTHLVGVYDAESGLARLYVDGVLKNTVTVGRLWLATGPTTIGRTWWNTAGGDYFGGAIDDVRLYQGVLTQDQITALSRS